MVELNRKGVAMISGGLDSTLAVKILQAQGITLTGLYFSLPWGCCDETRALKTAKALGIEFVMRNMITPDYLKLLRKPRYGYGAGMNPCVDCRIYMFKEAQALMEEIGASFLVTGEVLGQRPMSQMSRSIALIEKRSGLTGLIVRPLSAKKLAPTLPEKAGVIDREALCGIVGRSRRDQIKLAAQYGINDYPNAAGGCLLTDQHYGGRLKDLFGHQQEVTAGDMELLRIGRHFRVNDETKLIVGRNEKENGMLAAHLAPGRMLLEPHGFSGPSALLEGSISDAARQLAVRAIAKYTPTEKLTPEAVVNCRTGMSCSASPHQTLPLEEGIGQQELDRMRIE